MTFNNGLHLLVSDVEGLADGLDSEKLAEIHPIWTDVAKQFETAPEMDAGYAITAAAAGLSEPPVVICGPCTSSLEVAWSFVRKGLLQDWGSVVAVSQRSGRGRLRHEWSSPPGNLYAAIKLPRLPRDWLDISSLWCGLFAVEALRGLGAKVKMKWPNDLMIGDRKLGGILVEERGEECVVGMGINIAGEMPGFKPREEWSPGPVWLSETIESNLLQVLAELVKSGQYWYEVSVALGPPERFVPAFEKRLAFLDRTVTVHGDPHDEPAYTAKVLGLLPDGALLVESKGEKKALHSGSITPMSR